MEWEKIFANYLLYKELVATIKRTTYNSTAKQQITGLKMGRWPELTFFKEYIPKYKEFNHIREYIYIYLHVYIFL